VPDVDSAQNRNTIAEPGTQVRHSLVGRSVDVYTVATHLPGQLRQCMSTLLWIEHSAWQYYQQTNELVSPRNGN
jgi:hypothetical protein